MTKQATHSQQRKSSASLAKLDPRTPVVISQTDEPLSGAYGVQEITVLNMKRDRTYAAAKYGTDAWHEADWLNEYPDSSSHRNFDPPQQVAYLIG